MEPVIGIVMVLLGGLSSASFYVPSYKIKLWAWETYWITLGFVAWIVMPPLVAWTTTPVLVRRVFTTDATEKQTPNEGDSQNEKETIA